MPFKISRSVYGWYLILALDGVFGNVHALIACLAVHQIASTIFNKSKDLWLLKILLGKRAAEVNL